MKEVILFFLILTDLSLFAGTSWDKYKRRTLHEMSLITGWCSDEKAHLIMDLIQKNKCQSSVELGVFAGKSLFPMLKACAYNRSGIVYAIDAWNASEAVKGFKENDPNFIWWSALDLEDMYRKTLNLVKQKQLSSYCKIIKLPSENACNLFENESIDFIHIDANHNENSVFQDVTSYFPKLKNGGYLLLTDPNWYSMRFSLIFLMERADIITPFSPSAQYFLFCKNEQRIENANKLTQ